MYSEKGFTEINLTDTVYFIYTSIYTYCIEIWGMTFKCHIDPLFKIQKKALRLITHSHRLAHTESLFKELNILTIEVFEVFTLSYWKIICFLSSVIYAQVF